MHCKIQGKKKGTGYRWKMKNQQKERKLNQTSAPVLAALSTTWMSWLVGIGPVDLAPTFWYGISESTAFVQNVLLGFAVKTRAFWYPEKELALCLGTWHWVEWLGAGNDLGTWENLRGTFVKETRDLPIFCYSGFAFVFVFVSLLLCVPKSLKLASIRQESRVWSSFVLSFFIFFLFLFFVIWRKYK